MRYKAGKIGRVFVVEFDHDDQVIDNIVDIAKREDIRAGIFYLLGGIKNADIVVGPEKEELPPEPVWRRLDESYEALGMGTIFWHDNEPKVHFHGAFGKKDNVKVGCLRGFSETFIIMEGIILEIKGVEATREIDPATGLALLRIIYHVTPT